MIRIVLASLVLISGGSCFGQQHEDEPFLGALDAGIKNWSNEIEFVGEFEYTSFWTEDGKGVFEPGFFDKKQSKVVDSGTGLIAKRDGVFRIKFDVQSAIDFDPETMVSSFMSFDAASNGRHEIVYYPPQVSDTGHHLGRNGTFSDLGVGNSVLGRQAYFNTLNPFSSGGGTRESAFGNQQIKSDRVQVERSPGQAIVTFDGPYKPKYTRYTIGLNSGFPQLKKIESNTRTRVLRDFVDVGNGCAIAKECIIRKGPTTLPEFDKPMWLVVRFKSNNLGEREPTEADISVVLNEGVEIEGLLDHGLTLNPNSVTPVDPNLAAIARTSVSSVDEQFVALVQEPSDTNNSKQYAWYGFFAMFFLLFLGATRLVRKRLK